MHRVLSFIFLTTTILVSSSSAGRGQSASQSAAARHKLIDVVAAVLQETDGRGSLAESWKCGTSADFSEPFRVKMPTREGSAVERLHAVFGSNPSILVSADKNNLVRVIAGNVKTDLLDVTIKRIAFHNEAHGPGALSTILDSPEVRGYMEQHHIENVLTVGGIYPAPSSASPRLDGTKDNLKLSEALDLLPVTFSGMWSYQECTEAGGKRRVAFHFMQW